jgi:hypothetical protein
VAKPVPSYWSDAILKSSASCRRLLNKREGALCRSCVICRILRA